MQVWQSDSGRSCKACIDSTPVHILTRYSSDWPLIYLLARVARLDVIPCGTSSQWKHHGLAAWDELCVDTSVQHEQHSTAQNRLERSQQWWQSVGKYSIKILKSRVNVHKHEWMSCLKWKRPTHQMHLPNLWSSRQTWCGSRATSNNSESRMMPKLCTVSVSQCELNNQWYCN